MVGKQHKSVILFDNRIHLIKIILGLVPYPPATHVYRRIKINHVYNVCGWAGRSGNEASLWFCLIRVRNNVPERKFLPLMLILSSMLLAEIYPLDLSSTLVDLI